MATKTPSPALVKQVGTAETVVDKLNLAWHGYTKEYGWPSGSITGTPAYVRVLPKSQARMNFNVDPKDMERILAWFKECGLRPQFRWSTGTLTITEETLMNTKDPLIEAAVAHLAEEVPWALKQSLRDGKPRVDYLAELWASGLEEDATKQAYEWVKTGVLSRQEFHKFIHNLVA